MGHWANRFLPEIVSDVLAITPNIRLSNPSKGEIRFGTKGSLSLKKKPDGSYVLFSHEDPDLRGDAVTFIMKEKGLDTRGAMDWLDRHYGSRVPADERHVNGYAGVSNGIVYGEAPPPSSRVNESAPAHAPDQSAPVQKKKVAEWFYHDASGNPVLRVTRFALDDGGKTYAQHAMVDGQWVTPTQAKAAGRFVNVPYDLHRWHNAGQEPIFITEGEKCADAIKSLGLYASTNAGGAQKWADELAQYFTGRNVVIMPDADEAGAKWAEAVKASLAPVASRLHVATIGTPREDKALNDVADWMKETGSVVTTEFLDHIKSIWVEVPKATNAKNAKRFLTSAEFAALHRPPSYLVDGIIEGGYLYTVTSPTGHGKTAVALDLAQRVARGIKLNTFEVDKGRVLYLAGENYSDVLKRHIVMAERWGYNHKEIDIHWLPGVMPTTEYAAAKTEIEQNGPVKLIVVDTLQAFFDGQDSNNNAQVVEFMRKVRMFNNFPGNPTVLVLAHPVKGATTAQQCVPYGGGGILNEVDGNFNIWTDGETTKLHWTGKMRGANFNPITFKLNEIESAAIADVKGRSRRTVVAEPIGDVEAEERENESVKNMRLVMGYMFTHPGASFSEIAKGLGWFKGGPVGTEPEKWRVQNIIKSLVDEWKYAFKGDDKRFHLTPKGIKRVKTGFANMPQTSDEDDEF